MTKILKIIFIVLFSLTILTSCLYLTYFIITKDAKLDESKLTGAGQFVSIYDDEDNMITDASLEVKNKTVKVENLKETTINAFIASEDRTFFKHNGLNYRRMLKALYRNVTSGSFKEGASTISQQLIKNTHLSNDKTIKRKLKEIKLTKQLEKRYSKNEILEMYLNTIYFGHSCYGLQSAAEFYFGKNAEELDLCESATVVGLLSSPNNYSPFKNPDVSLKRRNLVLKSMMQCSFIDETTYNDAIKEPLNVTGQQSHTNYGDYVNAVFDELSGIDFNFYSLADGCKIKTYLNTHAQNILDGLEYQCDNATIISDNSTGGIKAYKTTIGGAKRQPGSTVKPLFVYAPAIEEKMVHTFTKILDEKINFNGYSPENYDKKYHGYVSVTDSIKNSYNIPAVKTLNALTINTAEKYLTRMNIHLEDDEKNLALALGGMKYGLSIKEIADIYSILPNGGNYRPSKFIKEIITKDGITIYKNQSLQNKVYSQGTCSLLNDALLQTTENGTAKKLKNLGFNVATKTGTCGNSEGNTDAYAVSYTSRNCIAVWLGDKDNNRSEITGGNECCKIMKEILKEIYSENPPEDLDISGGTETIKIDREEFNKNNKIIIADSVCPKLNVLTVKVISGNKPANKSTRFSNPVISSPVIIVENDTVNIKLCQTKYYSYIIKRSKNGKSKVIYDGEWVSAISDTPGQGSCSYSVTPYYDDGTKQYLGLEIELPQILISNGEEQKTEIPDIVNKDWYNQ